MPDSWTQVLPSVRAEALDCLQTTFSLIADHAHHPGAHLGLGTRWGFRPRRDGTLAASLADRTVEAGTLLGLRVRQRWPGVSGAQLRELATAGPLYVAADTFQLPWCPYAGQQHLTHSFLLLPHTPDRFTVVDAYHNDTPWGAARPGLWTLTPAEFDAAVGTGATALRLVAGPLPVVEAPAVLAANAAGLRAAAPAIERYLATAQADVGTVDGLERLVLDIWLLSRERLLHAGWLAEQSWPAMGSTTAAAQAREWQQLSTQSYVALRRTSRGRPAGAGIVDRMAELLARDTSLAEQLAERLAEQLAEQLAGPAGGAGAASVQAAVHDALRDTLRLADEVIRTARTLRDLPGFDSFRLVDVIERVERRLGVEVSPDRIAPANLRDVAGLCRMFSDTAPAGSRQ